MSCQQWHEAIALFVDGERPGEDLAEHLERCDGCRQLLRDLQVDQAELQRAPDIDPAVFAAVRVEVLGRVVRRKIWWRWWVAAASFVTLLLATGIWPRAARKQSELIPPSQKTPAPRPVEKGTIAPGSLMSQPVRRVRIAKRTVASSRKSDPDKILSEWLSPNTRREPLGSQSEVAMRIQTADPDVVILWLKQERFQQ
jgi:hypothetical protein